MKKGICYLCKKLKECIDTPVGFVCKECWKECDVSGDIGVFSYITNTTNIDIKDAQEVKK